MYTDCPKGSVPTEDHTRCMSDVQCSSFIIGDFELTQDPKYATVCNKTAIQKEAFGLDCPDNTVEYLPGLCYARCPAGLVENGLSCFKRSIRRHLIRQCRSLLTWYDGQECVPNPLSFLIIFVSLGLFLVSALMSNTS